MQKRHSDRVQYFKESAATSQRYYMPYIARFHAIHCNARVLEIGCGEGGNLLPFARQGCEVWGIDLCEERIRQAQDYFQKQGVDGHFDCVDFLCWPKPAGKADLFDIILLHDVIEHVPDKQTFVRSISMFLKSDGVLFVLSRSPHGTCHLVVINRFAIILFGQRFPSFICCRSLPIVFYCVGWHVKMGIRWTNFYSSSNAPHQLSCLNLLHGRVVSRYSTGGCGLSILIIYRSLDFALGSSADYCRPSRMSGIFFQHLAFIC